MNHHSLVELDQLSKFDIDNTIVDADNFMYDDDLGREHKVGRMNNKSVALLFYEPSTRTRLSFQRAVQKLGAMPMVIENPHAFSSVAKGETFADTLRVVAQYADVIVLRHPEPGSAKFAAELLNIPVINAGDGNNEHPTQALLDLMTIYKHGGLNNRFGLIAGDLVHSRTVHSLLTGLDKFDGNRVLLYGPEIMIREQWRNLSAIQNDYVLEAVPSMENRFDFVYVTRPQTERWTAMTPQMEKYELDLKTFNRIAGPKTILMHPLPRNEELHADLDDDPRSVYLTEQIKNGIYIRMALLYKALTGC